MRWWAHTGLVGVVMLRGLGCVVYTMRIVMVMMAMAP